ncbi:MAG: hypothetical protein ACOH18_02870 [Candidatus Saccharimonadaceae bacterium]
MKRIKFGRLAVVITTAALATFGLSACSYGLATPTGMCGWVVGDGQNGHDAKIKSTVWPDQTADFNSDTEERHFVPCGPRNFIITDGGDTGDYNKPVEALTGDGTPVKVTIDALWQLNQDENTLAKFAELCNKYTCYTTEAAAGKENNSTAGWNDMLQENTLPAIQGAVKQVMPDYSDDIWKKQDPKMLSDFAAKVSKAFMETIRTRTGYNVDLFCGSGNSAWSDPANPGAKGNTFNCTQVRFDNSSVKAVDSQVQNNASVTNQTKLDTDANQGRFDKSVPLYGDQTHYWLGLQDTAGKCPSGSTCNFYLGNIPTGQ